MAKIDSAFLTEEINRGGTENADDQGENMKIILVESHWILAHQQLLFIPL